MIDYSNMLLQIDILLLLVYLFVREVNICVFLNFTNASPWTVVVIWLYWILIGVGNVDGKYVSKG